MRLIASIAGVYWGSGVRNRVDKRLAYLFLCQVARIRCNEVGLGGSRRHRVHAGRLFSRTLNAPLLKGKVLVGSSVRRFIRKFVWLELSDPTIIKYKTKTYTSLLFWFSSFFCKSFDFSRLSFLYNYLFCVSPRKGMQ